MRFSFFPLNPYFYYRKDSRLLTDTGILNSEQTTMVRQKETIVHTKSACARSLAGVRDALYVLNGKWKLPIIIALSEGPLRFKDLQRRVEGITPKLLSKELKELEQNEFVVRHVYPQIPVLIEYELTEYSNSLDDIIEAMADWGLQHRARIQSR
ncbi:hypothetical protein GCM10028803_15010 [Larkinella knui]